MFSKAFFVFSCAVAAPTATDAFQAPENPTGLKGLNIPLIVKTPPVTAPENEEIKTVINLENLSKVGKVVTADDVARGASFRKRWEIGISNAPNDYVDEYWYNPTIHSFGNIGIFGALHAALAPLSTKIIDMVAYDGEDVRSTVSVIQYVICNKLLHRAVLSCSQEKSSVVIVRARSPFFKLFALHPTAHNDSPIHS